MVENTKQKIKQQGNTPSLVRDWLARPIGKAVVVGLIAFVVAAILDSALMTGIAAGGAYLGFEWIKEGILKVVKGVDSNV